jgi:acetyltransferase-like isoleucine patch superfamily enzyme
VVQQGTALVASTSTASRDSITGRVCVFLAKLRLIGPAANAYWQLRHADHLGRRITLRGRAKIVNRGTITLGDRVRLDSTLARLELVTIDGGRLEIGSNVFINFGSSIVAGTEVKIGNDCLIGAHVTVMDTDFHRVEDKAWDTTGQPVVIQDRVWLGNRSIVLKGVRIGHDAVVAAGAVVTKDVPPRTVVAGNPARVVRRF